MDNKKGQKLILDLAVLLLYGIMAATIYSNTVDAPFYFDDIPRIQDNPFIRITEIDLNSLKRAASNPLSPDRYISNLSFASNYYFYQYRIGGYHIVNILIHMLCVL